MKSKENIRAGQLVMECKSRFTDPRTGTKMPRMGVIEEISRTKARIFFYIGPPEPLEVPLAGMTKAWKEWNGEIST